MNEETIKTYHRIDAETWKIFRALLEEFNTTTEFLDIAASKFTEYEQLWKYTQFWEYAGKTGSTKLQEIERIWKQKRKEIEDGHNT